MRATSVTWMPKWLRAADAVMRPPSLSLGVASVDLRDALLALVQGLGGLPVLDEHALDHLGDHVRVQHLARGRGRRAGEAHRHAGLGHLDEMLERGLLVPEGAVEEPLVDRHPAAAGGLDDLVVV